MSDLQPYERHTLTDSQLSDILEQARKVMKTPHRKGALIVARLLAENASLAAECNAHRAARGMEPLPVFEPKLKV